MMKDVITEPSRLEKIIGCFLGVLLGDTLGMPFETMSPSEIMLATNKKGFEDFSKPLQLKIRETGTLNPGDYTDDWRLTRAVVKALIAKRDFDLMYVVREHLLEIEESYVGFGASTMQNLLMILSTAPVDWKTNPQFKIPTVGELKKTGAGNGVAMKIAPLAIFFHDDPKKFLEATIELSLLTHKDPQAMLAAYSLGIMLQHLYHSSIGLGNEELLKLELMRLMQAVIAETLRVQQWYLKEIGHKYPEDHTDFSKNLIEVGRLVHNGDIGDLNLVQKSIGTGFYCAQSIPFAMAMFLRNPIDFRQGMKDTIDSGGDTDSNASMAGALIGINIGAMGIPKAWREYRKEYQEAGYLAKNLHGIIST